MMMMNVSYRRGVYGHPLYIPSKFLIRTAGLREQWHSTLWSQLNQTCFLRRPKALESFDVRVSSSVSSLLLMVVTVEPRYLNLFT